MRLLIIFIFLISNSFANEASHIKNLIINKDFKKYDSLTFIDAKNNCFEDTKASMFRVNGLGETFTHKGFFSNSTSYAELFEWAFYAFFSTTSLKQSYRP